MAPLFKISLKPLVFCWDVKDTCFDAEAIGYEMWQISFFLVPQSTKCAWLFLWRLDRLEVLGVYYSKPGIHFESDKSGSVVTYEIFFAFTIQQQRQLQMIRLNDHPRINENYGEKGKIIPIFFLPWFHARSGVVLSGHNEIRLERNLLWYSILRV